MFDYFAFVIQQPQWWEEHQVSSDPVFVFLLLLTCMMRSTLGYCIFKAWPDCRYEHPKLVLQKHAWEAHFVCMHVL
jgi:hypothetical protein